MSDDRALIDYDPVEGLSTFFIPHTNGTFDIHYEQDVTAFLEQNKRLQNDPEFKKSGIRRSWMHYANIPPVIALKWRKEGIDVFNPNHMPAIKRKLRDPDYRHLRTSLGNI